MEKIKKIPVIGYIIRLFVGILKFPKHMDTLYRKGESYENLLRQQQSYIETLEQKIQQLSNDQQIQYNQLCEWNADRMKEIQTLSSGDAMMSNAALKRLNYLLSVTPTIWGPEEKLHLSKLATVQMCTFNTNSGEITIGDYTFAGMNVSLLAGSHDPRLVGLPRRDSELKDGCDIVIGKGVWLASGCTILGPVNIEDNAVIAAGAVVVPGTYVKAGEIYGGIPARCIGTLDLSDQISVDSNAVIEAVKRENHILFVSGFSEKKHRKISEKEVIGHKMILSSAILYTDQDKIELGYQKETDEAALLEIRVNDVVIQECSLASSEGLFELDLTGAFKQADIREVEFTLKNTSEQVFFYTCN